MAQNAKPFDDREYRIAVVSKKIEVTPPIRDYLEEKIGKIEKITGQIIDVTIWLDVQKLSHFVDIIVKFSHFKVKVGATTENMYSAIDRAFEKLHAKLRRWKSRIQDHHAKGVSVTEMEVNVLDNKEDVPEDLDEEIIEENNRTLPKDYLFPKVVKTKKRPLKTLTHQESVMKMELSGDHFLLYRSEEEQTLKVIYRRHDGSYGIISAK